MSFFIRNPEQILSVGNPDHVVKILVIDKNPAEFCLDQYPSHLFQSGRIGECHDFRTGCHQREHSFIAELHHLLDQIRFVLREDALFLRRLNLFSSLAISPLSVSWS